MPRYSSYCIGRTKVCTALRIMRSVVRQLQIWYILLSGLENNADHVSPKWRRQEEKVKHAIEEIQDWLHILVAHLGIRCSHHCQ